MKILFIHQNFPGQFKFLAPLLARRGHQVVAMTMRKTEERSWQGVQLVVYAAHRGTTPQVHPWVSDFETKTIRGEALFRAALGMRQQGFVPDVIIAHHGWGESLFVKDVWPEARLGIYCEFFYRAQGADTGFDPEFPAPDPGEVCRLRLKNLNNLLHFDIADAGISPTVWQASTFPDTFRGRISVVHDGIDTRALAPKPDIRFTLQGAGGEARTLGRNDEVITFVNRNLEPYRGYHIFMRALPAILRARPQARILIVGGNEVSYGARPSKERYGERSWKDIFIDEVRQDIGDEDWRRVYFLGNLAYPHFVALLQLSRVHVYLTYPFVLSWSLLEAMSMGCSIVASDTAPVREAIQHDRTGVLVDFFGVAQLAEAVNALLDDPDRRERLGSAARDLARAHFDLHAVCLPRQLAWVAGLAAQEV